VDPLDAYMMGISEEVKENKPTAPKPKPVLELDEEDNVADYLEVSAPTLEDLESCIQTLCADYVLLHDRQGGILLQLWQRLMPWQMHRDMGPTRKCTPQPKL
jgi:hypothetical protein